MPSRILLIHTFEGDYAFDISTPERHEAIALAIVDDRFQRGFYAKPEEPPMPKLTYSQAKNQPEGEFRNFALGVWQRYRESTKKYNEEKARWDAIEQCISHKDGPAAISILQERSEYEGEDCDILEVKETYP